jgi:hypothetical protein
MGVGSSAPACGAGAEGGGGPQWSKLMVEAACEVAKADGGGSIRTCGWGPRSC